jgi:hypothetical protein
MGNLLLPRRNVQMATPIVFWVMRVPHFFIMNPPSHLAPPPQGFEKIECRHAHEVELWSNRLRQQEKRIREMTDEERYNFEEPIRAHGLQVLRELLAKATDSVNREFLAASIATLEKKRELRRKEVVETYMHIEAHEGLAP